MSIPPYDYCLSDKAWAIWAKSDRETQDGTWLPLILHMLDVAACAEVILKREPEATRRQYMRDFGFADWDSCRAWLLTLIASHDLGKASPSFANLWRAGTDRIEATGLSLFPAGRRSDLAKPDESMKYVSIPRAHHGFISQISLKSLLIDRGWTPIAADSVRVAVGVHHGRAASLTELKPVRSEALIHGGNAWAQIRKELFDVSLAVLSENNHLQAPTIEQFSPEAVIRLAGLTSFADWIGSNITHFKFQSVPEDLSQYYNERLELARQALDEIGWYQREPFQTQAVNFSTLFEGKVPRPLQQTVIDLMSQVDAPALMIVEAPMGEGKTEAALYAYTVLQQRLEHRGLYTALPTQATGNMMFKRIEKFLKQASDRQHIDLQLAHRTAILNTDFERLRQVGIDDSDGGESQTSKVRASEWFTYNKRSLLSEYGVGTVDQALLGVLKVKHFFVRLWGLNNRMVIIDEVHAYDTYTSSIIATLIRWLHALGSSVILLSATLPTSMRLKLLRAYGAEVSYDSEILNEPYPRVSMVCNGHLDVKPFEADPKRAITVQLVTVPTDIDELAPILIEKVTSGGCLACIVNTVQRAQDLYTALQAQQTDIELILIHARFPARQRQELEELIIQKFGPESGKKGHRPKRSILVATQVVEQSLDLDFDLMVTDLAPIDLILQRAGRLHRFGKTFFERYDHGQATLFINGRTQADTKPEWGDPLYWSAIYDEWTLFKTWIHLGEKESFTLPIDIEPLIKAIYEDDCPIPESLQSFAKRCEGESLATKGLEATQALFPIIGQATDEEWTMPIDPKQEPDENPLANPLFVAQTRLGEPSVTLIPFEQKDDALWLAGKRFMPDEEPHSLEIKALYARQITVTRKEVLNWFVTNEESLPALEQTIRKQWKAKALLRNAYPLILQAGEIQIGELNLRLDPLLGLVYSKSES